MKIMSSFTHPQVVSTLSKYISSVEHKRRYFVGEKLIVPIDFHSTVVSIWSGSKKLIKVVLRQERILVLGQLWWKVLIHFKCWLVYFFPYCGSQWGPSNCLVTHILQNIIFWVQQKKKCIEVWNKLRVSKWWQNFHFWVNYSFKQHIEINVKFLK